MIGFIKNFIKRKEEKIIGNSVYAVNSLDRKWEEFIKRDTYLIFDAKANFLNLVIAGKKETKIPWYFFWHLGLRSSLQNNLNKLDKFEEQIKNYNPKFIKRKKEEYKDLFKLKGEDDKVRVLDDDQQTAVITDNKHNLVVAGAGSGKTEVLITRIAYLIKRKSDAINPEKILALAFQNKAADEMKKRLKGRYDADVEIRTFHSLGLKIVREASGLQRKEPPRLHFQCSKDWKAVRFVKGIYDELWKSDKNFRTDILDFILHFGDTWTILKETDFKTKEEFYKYMQQLRYTCLDGEQVKSDAEREIKNFFLARSLNGKKIKIEYEQPADWMKYVGKDGVENAPKPDFYFPELGIYFEHWAIDEKGNVPEWFSGENPSREYVEHMNQKKKKYAEHKKILIETTHADVVSDRFKDIIQTRFIEALRKKYPNRRFGLQTLPYSQLVNIIWKECKEFIRRIDLYIQRYITIAKTYRMMPPDIKERLEEERWSPRQKAFSKIALRVFDVYQEKLRKSNSVDFSDMINLAVDSLKENKEFYMGVYDHILIDEYQDISTQRYELIKELMGKNENCKLFCVGDDWQSIMGFAGSNLSYFVKFDNYFANAARTGLTINYRSVKTIVDVGATIIKHNKKTQIQKKTVAHSEKLIPISVYSSLCSEEVFYQYHEQIAKHCLDMIKERHATKGIPYEDFLILTRINMEKNPNFANKFSDYASVIGVPITFEKDVLNRVRLMTAHKSKGLQARVVFIMKVDEGPYGFPSSLADPDIFEPVIKDNDGFREEEERRLFYVAATRAKEEVIMYSQKCIESKFITEIKSFIKREDLSPLKSNQ